MRKISTKKKFIKHSKFLSSKKTKKYKIFNNSELIKILQNSTKLKNKKETLDKLYEYFDSIKNKNNFNKLLEKATLFNKDKLGKSGANIGIIKINSNDKILKFYRYKTNTNIYDYNDNCIKLFSPYNEIILNIVISNLSYFFNNKSSLLEYRKKNYDKYILKLDYFGINDNSSFIINEKVGILDEINQKYYTTLYDLFKNNYLSKLLKAFKTNKLNIINKFCEFLKELLHDYLKCLQLINKTIDFIHTDLKCKNVFIKNVLLDNKFKKKFKLLIDNGFIINIIPLVSDLDKSIIKLNNTNIIVYTINKKERYLSKYNTRFKYIYNYRYNCFRDNAFCSKFKSYHLDRLTLFYDIYIYLYLNIFKKLNNISLKEYYDKITLFNNFVKKMLNINDNEFILFYKRINNSYLLKIKSSPIKLSVHINAMLYNFCNKLSSK